MQERALRGPVVVAGHSHSMALGVPATSDTGINLLELDQSRRRYALAGPPSRGEDYWRVLASLAENFDIALSWQGNLHFGLFLLEAGEPFDFVLSHEPHCSVADDRVLYPESYVETAFEPYMAEFVALMQRLRSANPRRVVVISGPPPRGDSAEVLRLVRGDDWFASRAKFMGLSINDVAVTPPFLMLKLYKLVERKVRELTDEYRFSYLPPPAEALRPDGYIDEAYMRDLTHCSADYGTLVWTLIEEQLAATGAW